MKGYVNGNQLVVTGWKEMTSFEVARELVDAIVEYPALRLIKVGKIAIRIPDSMPCVQIGSKFEEAQKQGIADWLWPKLI